MTLKNNRAPLLNIIKLYASFHHHIWIQTVVTVRKRLIWVKFDDFLSRMTLKFDVWPWKTIGHLFYANSSFVQHFVAIGELKLKLQSGNAQSGSNSTIFRAVWPWNLTDDLEKHQGTSPKHYQSICTISSSYVNLTGVTVRIRLSWVVTSVTLTFDLWPWPFAWTLPWSLMITPDNLMMIRWWEHSQKGVTDGQTGRQADRRRDAQKIPFIELLSRS